MKARVCIDAYVRTWKSLPVYACARMEMCAFAPACPLTCVKYELKRNIRVTNN